MLGPQVVESNEVVHTSARIFNKKQGDMEGGVIIHLKLKTSHRGIHLYWE